MDLGVSAMADMATMMTTTPVFMTLMVLVMPMMLLLMTIVMMFVVFALMTRLQRRTEKQADRDCNNEGLHFHMSAPFLLDSESATGALNWH